MVTQLFKGFTDMLLGNTSKSSINRSTPESTDPVKTTEEPKSSVVELKREKIQEKNREQVENISKPVLNPEQIVLKDKLVLEIMSTLKDKVPAIVAAALAQQNNEAKAAQETNTDNENKTETSSETSAISEANTKVDNANNPVDDIAKILKEGGFEAMLKTASGEGQVANTNPAEAIQKSLEQVQALTTLISSIDPNLISSLGSEAEKKST
ncbi:MAG: hypothetical protein HRT47_11570 [Candidatus Caenarcaniphilales bacterium]|nr:hypothetical protein [Candidatus Caenarcaniphilales bacterium]